MGCDRPDLQDALLNARARGERVERIHGEHLERCDACRSTLGVLDRVREHWDDDLSNVEVLRLRMRALPHLSGQAQRIAPRRKRAGYVVALVGAAVAGSAAAAATYYAVRSDTPIGVPEAAPASSQRSVDDSRRARIAASATEPAPAVQSSPTRQAPQPPDESARPTAAPARHEPLVSPNAASARALWAQAAEALKRNDRPAAERALAKLTASGDAVTRDSAELALIELWMKSRQAERGRAELARLGVSGATSAIRSRARSLARELDNPKE